MHTILSLCLVLANSYILNKETLKYNQQLCTVFLCTLLLCFLLLNGKNISYKATLCTITALDNKATLARE